MTESLEITTRIGCRVACSFCPQKTLVTNYASDKRIMTMEDFEAALSSVPAHVSIHFSGFAESLLNPLAPQMMLYASRKGHEIHFYSTLVGLTADMIEPLVVAWPRVVRVHVPDAQAMKVADDTWIALHELFLGCQFSHATYMAMGYPTEPVQSYLNECGVSLDLPAMLSRGGNVAEVKVRRLDGPIRCAADRWHNNVLLPNGDVQGCCMAYDLSLPLGNLLTHGHADIFARAEEYRQNNNPPADSICRSCEWSCPV